MGNTDKINCFAYVNEHRCNALTEKNCENCQFYKDRKEIKNNPFYPYSYNSLEEYEKDIKDKNIIFMD